MPLTPKGKKIMKSMKKTYGKKKAEQVFYASKGAKGAPTAANFARAKQTARKR